MKDGGKRACSKRRYTVTAEQLPLCCPMPAERVWDAHPRVYLPLEKSHHEICPYCGIEYILETAQDESDCEPSA